MIGRMLGTVVGNYRIVGQVAVGGMGTVFRAEHTLIGRVVAVKVLNPEMSANRDVVNRFFNEAKATTTINHPGIVEVFDFGFLPSGNAYLVMELLTGETLAQRMRARGRFAEGEAAMLMRGVCTALAAAHAKGIVHRDLKPDNIFLVPDLESPLGERTKILDFGIAKLTDVGLAGSATRTGAVLGTPTYMSPEQCRGTGNVDHRADLYSIGCILYELVSGRPPFVNHGAGELIGSHLFVEPEPVSRHAQVSPELERLIMSLLAKQPEQRVQTALDLAQELVHVAQLQGWVAVASTDPNLRASMQYIQPPGGARPMITPVGTPMITPVGTPVVTPIGAPVFSPTPAHALTPAPAPVPTPMSAMHTPAPAPTPAASAPTELADAPPVPTTLSGAASQAEPDPSTTRAPRSRKGVAILAGLVAAGAAIAIVVATAGGGGEPRAASSGEPPAPRAPRERIEPPRDPGEEQPAATPTPTAPAQAHAREPAPATEPHAATPPATPPGAPPVSDESPADPPASATEPVEAPPVASEEPVVTDPPSVSPSVPPSEPARPSTSDHKPGKPDRPRKPAKPAKPAKPVGGDLLETEL